MIINSCDNTSVKFTEHFNKQLWKANTNTFLPCRCFTYHFLRIPIVLSHITCTAYANPVLQRKGKSRNHGPIVDVITFALCHPRAFCHNRCDNITDVWKNGVAGKQMMNHDTCYPFTKHCDAVANVKIPPGCYDLTLNSLNSERCNFNFK